MRTIAPTWHNTAMFWGLKIHNSRTYSATITSPLRISHGILDPSTNSNGLIELHITIGKRSDYVISRFDEDKDLVQHSLNIVLSYGDEITLYLRCKGSNACVHLCGYYLRSGPAAVHAVTWSEEALENKQVTGCKRKRVSFDLSNNKTEVKKMFNRPALKCSPVITKVLEPTNFEDLKSGYGKIAKNGRKVFIRYIGRDSSNQKIIDKIGKKEKPLCFLLGKGEVMRGLDKGIKGMRVGGTRKIIILPNERKPSETAAEISQDTTIEMEVELINVE